MLLIRKLHAYIGLVIAPSVLFFALSGALQLFNLHEAHGSYHPTAVLRVLGSVHKDQVLSEPEEHHGPPPKAAKPVNGAEPSAHPPHEDEEAPKVKTYVLKWCFALVAAGLFFSTLMGVWIGLRFSRTPRLSWGLLTAGVAVPLLILVL